VTPSYNQAEFIGRTIESVLSQRGEFELEYLVFDGGSTDETREILTGFGDRLQWKSERDHGQIDAINRGLKAATGDIIGWINSDDLLLPDALRHVSQTFQTNPNCLWLHGNCAIIDRNDREIRKGISAYKRFIAKRYSRSRLLSTNFISQMTVFWRRELIDKVGLLDPSVPLASICPPIYVDEKLAAFRWYATSKSGANYRTQIQEENALAKKHGANRHKLTRKWLSGQLRMIVYRSLDRLSTVPHQG
jgi:glycosyltransferase involved in cell wall biosynthesis